MTASLQTTAARDLVSEARLASTLVLDEPVTRVKLVSPARASVLAKLHIKTVRDLVTHYPTRYIDMSRVATVAAARIGDVCTICGQVYDVQVKRPKRIPLVEITLVDGTGTLMLTMFRQVWLADKLKPGMTIAVAGKLDFDYGFKRMTNPFLEVLEQESPVEGVIVPVHPATEKISPAMMRRLVSNALDLTKGVLDPLPLDIRLKYRLMSRGAAFECIHFPHTMEEQAAARRRLVYEELLMLQLALMVSSARRSEGKVARCHVIDGPCMKSLCGSLPFQLTNGQNEARDQILSVMASDRTANHMLLGDVGTGKTIVAAHALAAVADTGSQAAFMAPTEILAEQHAASLGPLLDKAGVSWGLLTGSTSAAERDDLLKRLADGSVTVLFGTHALLQDDVVFRDMSLAVIDEQQRFGVDQRATLLSKGENPDALYLTATPIPRSLALALFGNLTLSYLREKPKGVMPRTTTVHPRQLKGAAYDAALEALRRGEQVYIVCPLVGEAGKAAGAKRGDGSSSASGSRVADRHGSKGDQGTDEYEFASISIEDESDLQGLGTDVAAARSYAEFLQRKTFVDFHVELLHGKLPAAKKREIMESFAKGETQVLVATTVIEVGINVPNATVMIVEDADRFGLAQLHQLRGRVGRGSKAGEVHLISGSKSDVAMARLHAMEQTEDGFELSNYDLSLRREGDILGNRQSGASGLKLVNIVRDGKVIEAAHDDAAQILAADPVLEEEDHRALAREMRLLFKDVVVQGG